jgi:hypothetical protein
MPTSGSDQELLTRQAALQAEASQVLAELDLGRLLADVGPVLVVGSYLSGLMCWRDLDVCLLAGVECSPSDVLELLKRVVELPGFVGFSYRDERGSDARPARPETSATTCPSTSTPARGAGASTCRCGCGICMVTSPTGMGGCATPSPMSSGWLCCGSKMCGIGCTLARRQRLPKPAATAIRTNAD